MRNFCVLPGGDAVPGGAGVEVLSCGLQDGAVSSELVENHTGVNGGRADRGVLQRNGSRSSHRQSAGTRSQSYTHSLKFASHQIFTNRNQQEVNEEVNRKLCSKVSNVIPCIVPAYTASVCFRYSSL